MEMYLLVPDYFQEYLGNSPEWSSWCGMLVLAPNKYLEDWNMQPNHHCSPIAQPCHTVKLNETTSWSADNCALQNAWNYVAVVTAFVFRAVFARGAFLLFWYDTTWRNKTMSHLFRDVLLKYPFLSLHFIALETRL